MAVSAATRFEASKTALNALIPESTGLTKIRLDELVEMMVERMRPTGGRTVTLGPGDVADLERAARQRGQDVEELFKGLLKDALAGMIDVDGQRLPVLLIDDVARDQLANFAGVSFNTDQTVRPSLAATADDGSRRGSERTASFLTNQDLLLKAQGGMARGSRREKPPSELGLIMQGVRNLAGDSSIAGETLEALGPRIEQSVSSIGLALWKDRAFRSSFSHVIKDPKLFCGQVG